jgi:NAD(P)-dependent dehydrogenase (short-subunit alcohol dehydrogenase family)
MELDGCAAVVSGGASGLGEATVRHLVAAGARCTIVDRDVNRGAALAEELGQDARFVAADVTREEDVAAAVAAATDTGPLRVVVSCAGIGWASRVLGRDGTPHALDPFRAVVEVNLIGTFNLLRLGAQAISRSNPLVGDERGVIVNTASVAAFEGQVGQVAYSASKGGIVGMTLPAARDLSPVGIRVVTIAPGAMDTPLLGLLGEDQRLALAQSVPFPRRLGLPADFARLVLDICRNGYLNGETIRLDGALRMSPR